uniref:Uncharacterized protein n=1 Tax=Panagrolaimus sp. ES5 TaxID=591445 RepID=A0AC34GRW1_9BILA
MVIHIGIVPHEDKCITFNTETNERIYFEVEPNILPGDLDSQINDMFKDITSKIKYANLGCACLSLNSNFGSDVREEFIQSGLKFGFNKVVIIDFKEALFHDILFQTNIHPNDRNVFWFINNKDCYIWEKNKNIATMRKKLEHVYYTNVKQLQKIKNDSFVSSPAFILYNDRDTIEGDIVKSAFPGCSLIPYKYDFGKNESNGALIKAQIAAGDITETLKFKI